jgi:signal transduction histidine kinase
MIRGRGDEASIAVEHERHRAAPWLSWTWMTVTRRSHVPVVALGVVGTILGEWGYRRGGDATRVDVARDIVVMWSYIIAGLIAWTKRPGNRVGPIMTAVGLTWPLWNVQFLPIPLFVTVGFWLQGLNKAFLGYLMLAFPTGRLTRRLYRFAVWLVFADVVAFGFMHAAWLYPGYYDCAGCTPLFTLPGGVEVFETVDAVYNLNSGVIALFFVSLVVHRWLRASPPARRALAPVWLAGAVTALLVATDALRTFGDVSGSLETFLMWAQDGSMTLLPVAFLIGLLRVRTARGPVGRLALEMREPSGSLRDTLARALGDRSLQLAFPTIEAGRFIDENGRPFELPGPSSGRSATVIDNNDRPLAVLVHDPALDEEDELLKAVGAVATLALENKRLHAEVKAQLDDVRASRGRIVEAADEERRKVERNLHDGAQQRLVTLSLALRMAQDRLGDRGDPAVAQTLSDAAEELSVALSELRELARGIHPAILTEEGLGPALESLADRSPVLVDVSTSLEGRLSPPVEATAYFTVSEALTNVTKYAGASSVRVSVDDHDDTVTVEIVDDGIGGANPSNGTGLRGLMDRVAALGGDLDVVSPPGNGTTVRARIPRTAR